MFEPLNALEQALMAAATDPDARRAFTQALLESELFISPAGEPPADGGIDQLAISRLEQGETPCVFTARERVAEVLGTDAPVRGMVGRELLPQLRVRGAHINPNLDYGVVYSPADITEILGGVTTEIITKSEEVLLGHPAQKPEALIKALGAALGGRPDVKGAWLLLSHRASEPKPSWLIGVDCAGPWEPISAAIGAVGAVTDLAGNTLSAIALKDDGLARTLRGGIPIVAARAAASPNGPPKKRGLFDFLKG
jgi:hypothetical protein